MRMFTVFCRIVLAIGFLPSGMQKVLGYRFTALPVNHPMGNYLEALFHTGYYHNFLGIGQVLAAILLLIPRTALLGAVLYFPIILNITVLSFSVRFDGSLLSSPLMVLANFYLLCWDYDRLKLIFFPKHSAKPEVNNKFPFKFFIAVFTTCVIVVAIIVNLYELRPRNHMKDCLSQCEDAGDPEACIEFCDCIHNEGKPLNTCLTEYEKE